ncbi:MAG: NAD(P)H-binding protein, partial [Gemmatimonadota bacterium]
MIAVMGATGNTGGVISERLLESGAGVRVLGRSADKLAALVEKGAEAAVGEASDAGYLASAFRGADAVYTLIPPNLQADDYSAFQDRAGEAITQAIRESGVRHVVFLSSIGADQPEGTGPIAGLYRQEGRLRSLEGVNVLALRPAYFFENHLYTLGLIQHQGINGGAIAPDVPMAMIATRDIAEAAAR